jgi:predicted ATP-dependent endonuclease of OLD family
MLEILDADKNNFRSILEKELTEVGNINKEELSLFSSGQAMLVNFITSLLAWVKENTLIIFDEPEMHLHPNAIASLFSVLNDVLKRYESFALIATHSPQFIQEIPTKRVIVFERTGNITEVKSLVGETLGENISNLTRHIFETYEIPSNYKLVLKNLSKGRSYEDVISLFEQGLSMNARSYLLSCYQEGGQE